MFTQEVAYIACGNAGTWVSRLQGSLAEGFPSGGFDEDAFDDFDDTEFQFDIFLENLTEQEEIANKEAS